MIHNPCLLLLLQLLLRIESGGRKRKKEKERLTWSCYLKTKAMVMEGWLTNVTFFLSTFVFRSLYLCSCFSLFVFSLFIFFISLVPSVSLCSCSSLSLSVLSVLVHFSFVLTNVTLWLLFVRPGFLGLYLLVGSTTYSEGKLKFSFLLEEDHKFLCLLYASSFFFGLTWVNPSQPI